MATDNQLKVVGVLVDLYHGSIHLVSENTIHPPAFGRDASAFSIEEQERQRFLITKQQIIPMFSLMDGDSLISQETPIMKVNFGQTPFFYSLNAMPLTQIHQHFPTKGIFEK
jgi:hypothetical protein